ncbi:MAG: serine hydrolase [Proteobacteria bacterium]|nr:serine hydrolase [Pseudomonadota bacterium]
MMVKPLTLSLLYLILTACSTVAVPSQTSEYGEARGEKAVQNQLTWVLETINELSGSVKQDELQRHFHPSFLAQMSTDQLVGVFSQLSSQFGKLKLTRTDPVLSPAIGVQTLIAHASTKNGKVKIILSVDASSGLINGLFVQPDTEVSAVKALNFNEAERQLRDLPYNAGFEVAELVQGQCQVKYEYNAAKTMAIGSTFKLYVLDSLLEQIRLKKMQWSDQVGIRDDWKSLPSGTMQFETAGKLFTLEKLAEKMISISDNTATDHLIKTLGREKVEAAIKRSTPSERDRNIPLLTTREFFFLKFNQDKLKEWLVLNLRDKRKFLDDKVAHAALPASESGAVSLWKTPRNIDAVEWFASPKEI